MLAMMDICMGLSKIRIGHNQNVPSGPGTDIYIRPAEGYFAIISDKSSDQALKLMV